jgi:serine/threonine protein kinase
MPKTRRLKNSKRKTRRGGSKQYKYGNITNLNEKHNGLNFFRKYGASIVEHKIAKILQTNPHPNIVKIYNITDQYIDIEEVKPTIFIRNYDKKDLVNAANLAKTHLQSLGIMYIDWKPDNLGVDSNGTYKLYDFDASGITTADGKNWLIRPSDYWSYRQALANGKKDPKEIDDFAFDINFTRKNYVPLDNSHI